ELLRLAGVDVEIVAARVLADDHSLVELVGRGDEERSTFLEALDREARRLSAAIRDKAACRPRPQLAVPGLPPLEDVVHDPAPAGLGEELGPEADQSARGDEVLHPRPAGAVVDHLLQAAFAEREELSD